MPMEQGTVVTEHGIADPRGRSAHAHAHAYAEGLTESAAPQIRKDLTDAWREMVFRL